MQHEHSWQRKTKGTPDPSEPRIRYANCCLCNQTPWDTLRHLETPGKHETWWDLMRHTWDNRTGPVGIPSVESIHCFALFRRSSLRVLAMTSEDSEHRTERTELLWFAVWSRPRVQICKNETWFQTMQNSWASKFKVEVCWLQMTSSSFDLLLRSTLAVSNGFDWN